MGNFQAKVVTPKCYVLKISQAKNTVSDAFRDKSSYTDSSLFLQKRNRILVNKAESYKQLQIQTECIANLFQ